jgi:HlyD family secretion protein
MLSAATKRCRASEKIDSPSRERELSAGSALSGKADPVGPARLLVGLLAAAALCSNAGCRDDPDALSLVGSVERTLIELTAAASEVIVSLPAARGQHLQSGATVVQLDSTLAAAEVARAEAASAAARTRQSVSVRDLERAADLHRRRIVSEDQLEHAQLESDEAAAHAREAEAVLAMARKRLADLTIVTPASGVVDQLPYELGERVPAGAVVAVILQDELPWVRIWIPEPVVVRVAPGTSAAVRIDGFERPFAGRVLDIAREPEFTPHYALTERERSHLVYETRVQIADAPAGLRPGSAATVVIRLDGQAPEGRS